MIVESLEDRRLLATFTVVTAGDAGLGTCTAGQCTLRDAITAANAGAGADDIQFAPSITGTISLNPVQGALQVSNPVSIVGPGAGQLTVQADTTAVEFRVIDVSATAGDVSIDALTLTGGRVLGEAGGAIRFQSNGTLTIRSSTISGNVAANAGAIYSGYEGDVDVIDSTISGNTAMYGSGGGIQTVDGNITVTSSVIDGNTALNSGGGLFSQYSGNITITDSEVTNNRVTYSGYHGGGISSNGGNLTISGSTITGNVSAGDGGGLYNYGGIVSITGSTISGNDAAYGGGAIRNESGTVSVSTTTIDSNRALYSDGGGISTDTGSLTLTRSTVSGNRTVTEGGGIATSSGAVVVTESTISGNTSTLSGGGIASLTGLISLTNVTVSGNTGNSDGGGVHSASAPVRIVNSTLTLNHSATIGGGIGLTRPDNGESLFIVNSIVAQNTATSNPDFTAPENTFTNLVVDNSLIGINQGTGLSPSTLNGGVPQPDGRGNLVGGGANPAINPLLGALDFNGGSTRTHSLQSGSLAIDAGDNALAIDPGGDGLPGGGDDSNLVNDQRSFPFERVIDGGSGTATVDMGAFETQPPPIFLVDTNTDVVDGDLSAGNRSLREVIQLTNSSIGADVIGFAPSVTGSITLDPALGSLRIQDSLVINGPGANVLTIAPLAPNPSRFSIFDIEATAGDVTISGLTLTRGNPNDAGGAIRFRSPGSLLVSHSTLRANTATVGAGIFADAGTVNVVASTLNGNDANSHGGAIAALAGSINVISSTISDNTSNGLGGGVYSVDATVSILNSTITLNEAGLEGGGVGLVDDNDGETLTIQNSIIAANSALSNPDFNAPGNPGSNLIVEFSLIGNSAGTTLTAGQPDAAGNLVGGGASPVINPMLDTLADNGGPTQTHALQEGSLAIDRGNSAILPADTFDIDGDGNVTEALPTDQRGAGREVGSGLDIGAFEIPPIAVVSWDPPADIVFGTLLGDTELDATSTASGTFIYTPAAGTMLNAGNAQTLSVEFVPDNLLAFQGATASTQINVLKADPAITWDDPADIDFGTLLSSTQLNASAPGVAGSFVYTPDVGTQLSGGANQTLMTTFTPDDLANYNEVTATASINVNPVDPVITWNDPADIVFGTLLSNVQLNASSSVAGTFAYSPDVGASLNAGDGQVLMVTFTPEEPANFNTVMESVTINVSKADPVITWSNPADISFGTQLDDTQLNATADVPGAFVYDPAAGTVLNSGNNQTLSVTFTPTDTDNFNTVVATVQINVGATHDYGDAPSQYPVLLADDGARHVTGSLRLGSDVDIDADGQPSDAADGDGADEDGVFVIADSVAVAATDTVSSFLVIASEAGLVDAWIDFNGNGDWNDAREQIATNIAVTPGANTISYTVPMGATPGNTAARFRISSAGNLGPIGVAADGEVEDYIVTLLDGAVSPNAAVVLPNSSATIRRDSGNVLVSDGSVDLLGVPVTAVGQLQVQGGSGDDTITVDFTGGDAVTAGGLRLDGLGGENTLLLVGQNPVFDLTATGNVDANDFANIDLTDDAINVVRIDAAAVSKLSPTTNTIKISGGTFNVTTDTDDSITFVNPADWRLTDPLIVNGRFIRVVTNIITGQVVQVDLPNPWQNPIEASDVNNSGDVTAGDALLIINELGRRRFSEEASQNLDDALATMPWPGNYYDQNGDGRSTALDALRVINRLRLVAGGTGEGESIAAPLDAGDRLVLMLNFGAGNDSADTIGPLADKGRSSSGFNRVGDLTDSSSLSRVSAANASESADENSSAQHSVDQLLADDLFLNHLLD